MIEYITTRELCDSQGNKKGKVRILKLKEEDFARVQFLCPECGKEDEYKSEWKEPFVKGKGINQTFFVQCRNCGFSLKLKKLRKEVKKRRKSG